MTITVSQSEDDPTDHLSKITAALNIQFQKIKTANPRGYLDEFENRLETIAMEIAFAMGARFEVTDESLVFHFRQLNRLPVTYVRTTGRYSS